MRKVVLWQLFFAFLFSVGASLIFSDFSLSNWKYVRDIRPTASVFDQQLVSFVLDNKVFESANQNLSDLRIVDKNNTEVAYKLTVEESKSFIQAIPVKITNVGSLPGQYTQLVLDLGRSGINHNSVSLITKSTNFRKRVEVEAGNDSSNWFVIKKAEEGPLIYDYSLDFSAKNTTVNYPDSTYRFLRVKIIDNGENPIKVDGASIFNNVLSGAREVTLKPTILGISLNKEKRATEIKLDLGAKGVPSNQVILSTNDANFNREVLIDGSDDGSVWKSLGSDIIFSYQTPKNNDSKTRVNYQEANFRFLRLTVMNRDNQPLTFGEFTVLGTLRKVVFLAKNGESYRLFYGNAGGRFPEYDLESYLQYLDNNNIVQAVLGPQDANKAFVSESLPPKPLSERFPFLLNIVLGVAVVILGTLVFKLLFKVKHRR